MQELEWQQSQLKGLKSWPEVHDLRGVMLVRQSLWIFVAEAALALCDFKKAVLEQAGFFCHCLGWRSSKHC